MFGGKRLARRAALLAMVGALACEPAFAGDRVTELTTMLSSSSEKMRLSAVLSLARLGDKRAMKPLVTALQDPNAQVRAVAATALGKLGHKATLPALRTLALDDVDETVRRTAREAALAVAAANDLDSGIPPAAEPDQPAQARKTATGFGRSPRAVNDRPDLFVTVKGCNDDSPGKADRSTRKQHADVLMTSLKTSLRSAPQVTMIAEDAQRWGLDARMLDVSVTRMEVVESTTLVEVAVELRLAISDNQGKMLSFLSGGAKVQVPRTKYKPTLLPTMRKDALEGATTGMVDKLLAHLRKIATS